MQTITPREREVLRLRFEEDLTQAEIGERIGVSQMQVSRLIRQSRFAPTRRCARAEPADARLTGGARSSLGEPVAQQRESDRRRDGRQQPPHIGGDLLGLVEQQHHQPERLARDHDRHAARMQSRGHVERLRSGGLEPCRLCVAQCRGNRGVRRRRSSSPGPSEPRRLEATASWPLR